MVGVHTPEFPFERDVDNVRRAVAEHAASPTRSRSTAATRSGSAFANNYWPAVYIADAEGRIRHHQFGEGGYEECERVVQQLLREAGHDVDGSLVEVTPEGFEVQADWATLESPETYLGYEQAQNFARRTRAPAATTTSRIGWGSISGRWPETGRSAPARSG